MGPTSPPLPHVQQTTCPGCRGASPPPSPTRRFLGTREWDGAPGKERRAGTSFCSEESDDPQAPNLDFSNSAMFYGLGLHWEYIFPCIFQAGILGSSTIRAPLPSSLGQRSPYSALITSHSLSLACKMPLVSCVGVCLCSVSWSLKHLNNFSHEPDCNLTDLRFGVVLHWV